MPLLRCLPLLFATTAAAASPSGLGRVHAFGDWHVGCDNTRRCEAQGYAAADEAETDPAQETAPPVALQVLRGAGPGAVARVRLGFGDDGGGAEPVAAGTRIAVQVGALQLTLPPLDGEGFAEATPAQTRQLLPALLKADELQWSAAGRRGSVSLRGATAALLKMDDLQRRVGTAGALVRPGPRPEASVPSAPPPPVVDGVAVPPEQAGDADRLAGLRATLRLKAEDCPLMDQNPSATPREVIRVSARRVIAVFDCWQAAYQSGAAAWLANDRPPFAAEPVRFESPDDPADPDEWPTELSLSRDPRGRLVAQAAAKGRGVGDCYATREWVWDGRRFALTAATQSPCTGFAAGGLPITLWRSVPAQAPVR